MSTYIMPRFQNRIFESNQFPFTLHCDQLSNNYRVLPHWHEEIEILVFKSGEAYAICNQEKLHCRAGDVLFINSFCFHSLEHITEQCTYNCIFFGINIIENFHSLKIPDFNLSDNPEALHALNIVIDEYENHRPEFQSLIRMQLNSSLIYIARNNQYLSEIYSTKKNNLLTKKMQQAIFYINHNLTNKISLEALCEITHLSQSRFSNVFKNYTGKTLIDYVNLSRCQYARTLYLTGKYSITECAEMSGYNSMPYFARKYRQIYGYTLSKTPLSFE